VRRAFGQMGQHLPGIVDQSSGRVALVDRREDGSIALALALERRSEACRSSYSVQGTDAWLGTSEGGSFCDCLSTSAVRIAARRSRSARICFLHRGS